MGQEVSAMGREKNGSVRINIYVHDSNIRRQIKTIAAQKEITISEYCLRAITRQMAEEKAIGHGENPLRKAIEKANRFRSKTFGKKIFAVSSADLIEKTREDKNQP